MIVSGFYSTSSDNPFMSIHICPTVHHLHEGFLAGGFDGVMFFCRSVLIGLCGLAFASELLVGLRKPGVEEQDKREIEGRSLARLKFSFRRLRSGVRVESLLMRRLALPVVSLCGCACGVVDPVENGKGSLDFTLLLTMRSFNVTAPADIVVFCDTELADRVDRLSVTVAGRVFSRYGVEASLLMTLSFMVIDTLDDVIRGILDIEEEALALLEERSKPVSVAWWSVMLWGLDMVDMLRSSGDEEARTSSTMVSTTVVSVTPRSRSVSDSSESLRMGIGSGDTSSSGSASRSSARSSICMAVTTS